MKFHPKKMALLFSVQVKMKERNSQTREDVNYPYTRINQDTNEQEYFE